MPNKGEANPPRTADLAGNDTDVIRSGRTKTRAYALESLGAFIRCLDPHPYVIRPIHPRPREDESKHYSLPMREPKSNCRPPYPPIHPGLHEGESKHYSLPIREPNVKLQAALSTDSSGLA